MPLHISRSHTHTRDYNTHPTLLAKPQRSQGFTLIELSIVLVIIGLLVGGVLVGQDLIKAAEVQAQIGQIEKYNTAVNTFRGKYGYLPGDIPDPYASQFGFIARGTQVGTGDGNGIIEGINNIGRDCGEYLSGEMLTFWVDLSQAGMVDGNFTTSTSSYQSKLGVTDFSPYFPNAKISSDNSVLAWGDACSPLYPGSFPNTNINYFTISKITGIAYAVNIVATPGISVSQAVAIDKKFDDGLPQSGNVTARYITGCTTCGIVGVRWASSNVTSFSAFTTATPASSTTCFDNNNTAGVAQTYSVGQNNGTGLNCALSYKMQ